MLCSEHLQGANYDGCVNTSLKAFLERENKNLFRMETREDLLYKLAEDLIGCQHICSVISTGTYRVLTNRTGEYKSEVKTEGCGALTLCSPGGCDICGAGAPDIDIVNPSSHTEYGRLCVWLGSPALGYGVSSTRMDTGADRKGTSVGVRGDGCDYVLALHTSNYTEALREVSAYVAAAMLPCPLCDWYCDIGEREPLLEDLVSHVSEGHGASLRGATVGGMGRLAELKLWERRHLDSTSG